MNRKDLTRLAAIAGVTLTESMQSRLTESEHSPISIPDRAYNMIQDDLDGGDGQESALDTFFHYVDTEQYGEVEEIIYDEDTDKIHVTMFVDGKLVKIPVVRKA